MGWLLVSDYYFFVLYSMVAMGFVMVFEWDSLFPDRRDYIVLTPLPISGPAIFWSKLAALVVFLTVFVVDANFFGVVLSPLVSTPNGAPMTLVARVAVAQAIACGAAGAFVSLAFAAVQGVLINCLTGRAFRRVSPWAQMACMALLIIVLFLTPFLAPALRPLFENRSPLLHWFPPFWFFALFMDLLPGRPAKRPGVSGSHSTGGPNGDCCRIPCSARRSTSSVARSSAARGIDSFWRRSAASRSR
jgi:hypothetical protein